MISDTDRTEVLFLALTRPTLRWGVPVEGFILNVTITFVGGMFASTNPSGGWHGLWRSPFVFWLAFFPIHFFMRQVVAVDYHGFRMIRLWLETNVMAGTVLENLPSLPVRSGKDCGYSV